MALTGLLLDTGCIVAAADASDRWHTACAPLLREHAGPLLVPALVVAEVAYLLRNRLSVRAESAFLRSVANGELVVVPTAPADWPRIAELVERYETLGTVDASVVATAERLGLTSVATLDRRDFSIVRPSHVAALTLLPE